MSPKFNTPKKKLQNIPFEMRVSGDINKLLQKGVLHHQKGELNEAKKIYEKILQYNPNQFDALQLLATALAQSKMFENAIQYYTRALEINSRNAVVYNNLASALRELKRFDEALINYDKALEHDSNYKDALKNRDALLKSLNNVSNTQELSKKCQLSSISAEEYINRGAELRKNNRLEEALENYDQAIKLKPDSLYAHYNRGNVLKDLRRLGEALDSYNRVIELNPDFQWVYSNHGNVLNGLGKPKEALESYDKAIKINSEDAESYWNKSLIKLLLGHYEEGWKLYEWRRNKKSTKRNYPNYSQPIWLGENSLLEGKTILVDSEQGFGDSIQFCRYLLLLKALNPRDIIFHVEKPLVSLVSTLDNDLKIIEKENPLPEFDLYCPLLSLPLAFKTNLDNIPTKIQYLYADQDKCKYWSEKLGEKTVPRIGLVWSGSTKHKNDHNRSLLLKQLSSLFKLPFEFHSLQKENRDCDKETLDEIENIYQHQYDLKDFSDTAALIEQMDIIISVDTSVAHLAGALGKKVWILLPFMPDYRWMLDREDSPWYPTARLFRQPNIGDWESVIVKLKSVLINSKNT